jgi:hypothetical protein
VQVGRQLQTLASLARLKQLLRNEPRFLGFPSSSFGTTLNWIFLLLLQQPNEYAMSIPIKGTENTSNMWYSSLRNRVVV